MTEPVQADKRYAVRGLALLAVLAAGIWGLVAVSQRGASPAGGGAPTLVSRRGTTMGPIPFLLSVVPEEGVEEQAAFDAAQAELDRVNEVMSTYRPASDLSRLNAAGAGEAVRLDPTLISLLERSHELSMASEGAFDPTGRPVYELWKRCGTSGRLPTAAESAAALNAIGWDQFRIDRTAVSVVKSSGDAQIDLGAIAKGYAADRAAAALKAHGVKSGLVEVGGEVTVFGGLDETRPWALGIRDPFHPHDAEGPGLAGVLLLTDGAVATSGNYFRFVEIDGKRYSHIIDPRTGYPVDIAPSVTVIAPDCTTADAWATALSVLGEEGLEKIESLPGVEAALILGMPEAYRIVYSSGFRRYLKPGTEIAPK